MLAVDRALVTTSPLGEESHFQLNAVIQRTKKRSLFRSTALSLRKRHVLDLPSCSKSEGPKEASGTAAHSRQTETFRGSVSESEEGLCSHTAEHSLSLQSAIQVQSVVEILTRRTLVRPLCTSVQQLSRQTAARKAWGGGSASENKHPGLAWGSEDGPRWGLLQLPATH